MQPGKVRIIGGVWRGRKLLVPDIQVRPTPDRVRETLFNWLAPLLPGAYCLDLFAGTGVLSFEALSRDASFAVLIDQSPQVIKTLKEEIALFNIDNAEIFRASLPHLWPPLEYKFDIVFVDPPYREKLLLPVCFELEKRNILSKDALIYLESDEAIAENTLPENWSILKNRKAGQVYFYLAKRLGESL